MRLNIDPLKILIFSNKKREREREREREGGRKRKKERVEKKRAVRLSRSPLFLIDLATTLSCNPFAGYQVGTKGDGKKKKKKKRGTRFYRLPPFHPRLLCERSTPIGSGVGTRSRGKVPISLLSGILFHFGRAVILPPEPRD